jgi:hypothetical protein
MSDKQPGAVEHAHRAHAHLTSAGQARLVTLSTGFGHTGIHSFVHRDRVVFGVTLGQTQGQVQLACS